jgi:hypothetical protein
MNTTQTALIKLVHADALEMTKHNAEQVVALYDALMTFAQSTPKVAPETEADLKVLEAWIEKAIGKDRITEMLDALPHITERIVQALNVATMLGHKPSAIALGPVEAVRLFDWLREEPQSRLASRWSAKSATMSVNDIEGMTYNGVTIKLSEKDGIDILT